MSKLYELATATIRLDKTKEFHELHKGILLPILEEYGIKPILLSETFVGGEIGKFFDVYEYSSWEEYQRIVNELKQNKELQEYYMKISKCILGTIEISLLEPMEYSPIK